MPEAEIRTLTEIDSWLTSGVPDWAVLLGIAQYKPVKVHGFITNDDRMLYLSRTLPVLAQTELTLFVCAGVGHDPIAATGMLLLHVPYIASRWTSHPELVVVQRPAQRPNELQKYIEAAAARHDLGPKAFRRTYELSREQLATPVREWYRGEE